MQNLSVGKVCLVADAVGDGLVGVIVSVWVDVGDEVTVAGSGVLVVVDVAVAGIVGVPVETTGGGVEKEFQTKMSKRMIPRMIGIANLRNADESIAAVL